MLRNERKRMDENMIIKRSRDRANQCLYNICAKYPQAYYEEDVCTCYEYDVLGNYQVAKEVYMKKKKW